jgi:hypothetical protein
MSAPPPVFFDQLRAVLVDQLPELAADWWPRVQAAARDGDTVRLALLQAEAENRIDHAADRLSGDVLAVLFHILTVL